MSALGIGVKVESEVVLPDGSRVKASGSPTLTLKQHVANELFAPSPVAVVQSVDRVCVVSIDGAVEDCVTSFSWSGYLYGTNNYIANINGYVTVSGSYMVGYVRIKAGGVVYFESGVSSPFHAYPGQVVPFTIRLIFSTFHSPSVGGGLPGVANVYSGKLLELLVDILRGARPANTYLTLERVRWEDEWGETILDVPLVRSYSPGATSGSAFHDFVNFVASGNLYWVNVDCVGGPYCLYYTLSSPLSVTTADRARFSVFVEVGYRFGLSDSVDLSLVDGWGWSVPFNFGLDDSVSVGLVDVWDWSLGYGLSDGVGLGLVDDWSYSIAVVDLVGVPDVPTFGSSVFAELAIDYLTAGG